MHLNQRQFERENQPAIHDAVDWENVERTAEEWRALFLYELEQRKAQKEEFITQLESERDKNDALRDECDTLLINEARLKANEARLKANEARLKANETKLKGL